MNKGCSKAAVMLLALVFSVIFMGCDNEDSSSGNAFKLQSTAVSNNQPLANKYCYYGVDGGENISLPFNWIEAPDNTQSFALIIPDPDGENWVHWAVFNIPANCNSIEENASGSNMPEGSIELENEFGTAGYGGPEPPPGKTHRYIATLYALKVPSIPNLGGFKSYQDIKSLLSGKVITQAAVTGTYSR
jgi:Raf kinase inhibitor-like YbhB/YbcL family protein